MTRKSGDLPVAVVLHPAGVRRRERVRPTDDVRLSFKGQPCLLPRLFCRRLCIAGLSWLVVWPVLLPVLQPYPLPRRRWRPGQGHLHLEPCLLPGPHRGLGALSPSIPAWMSSC